MANKNIEKRDQNPKGLLDTFSFLEFKIKKNAKFLELELPR